MWSWLRSERGVQVVLAWLVVITFFVVLWLFARAGGVSHSMSSPAGLPH